MLKSRRNKITELPSIDEQTRVNNKDQVEKTIESLGISRERLIITGSSILALLELERHAHDVDIILHPEELDKILQSGKLPNNVAAQQLYFSRPERLHFAAETSPLPSELFSHKTALSNLDFDTFLSSSAAKTPDGYLIVHPSVLLATKRKPTRIGTDRAIKLAQDRYDTKQLEQFNKETLGGRINGRLFRP